MDQVQFVESRCRPAKVATAKRLAEWSPPVRGATVSEENAGRAPLSSPPIRSGGATRGSSPEWAVFHSRLRGFVGARVGNEADADDLVQLILERAVAGSRIGHIANPIGWLLTIAHNAIVDYYRAQRRVAASDAEMASEDVAAPSEEGEDRAALFSCLQPLVDALPTDVRRLLEWAHVEGRSMRAIAGDLDLSVSGAKSRVQRARKDFLACLLRCCTVTLDARGRATNLSAKDSARCQACAWSPCSDEGRAS